MKLGNTRERYGAVGASLHWLVAITVFGLFGLGWYMVDLSYYDEWYRLAPDIHRSVGLILFVVVILRLVWRFSGTSPVPVSTHSRLERSAAHAAHGLLYVLMFVAMISGYLISTADGSPVHIFNWIQVPSITGRVRGMEDIAGDVHYWVTWVLVGLAAVHAMAALKHHFIDRDDTLRRMLPVRLKKS